MTENKTEASNLLQGYLMMLYFSGSMIMFDPSKECIFDFWTKGMLKQLPVKSNNPDFIRAAAILRESTESPDNKYELLKEDFFRLFSGAFRPLAPPYALAYTGEEKPLSEKRKEKLKDFYMKYKWESKFKNNIPCDHLGIELLFISHLIEKYIITEKTEEKTNTGKDIISFIKVHLNPWLARWVRDVNKNALSKGYRGIAMLIKASLEDIYYIIDNQINTKNNHII